MTWKLAEAKNRLTEVVNLALSERPQTITRRNDTVVLLAATVLRHGLHVMTRNSRHFEASGALLIDPRQGSQR